MLRRRVPVLKLGVWGLGGLPPNVVALCSRSVREASASVRERPQAFAGGVARAVEGELHRDACAAAFGIRQAKGELHRARVPPRCSETVKLRRKSTGRVCPRRSAWRSAEFRMRQGKGELHRMRAAVAFHVAFRGVPNPSS